MRVKRIGAAAVALAGIGWLTAPGVSSASTPARPAVLHYQHIVEIMMENTSYSTIIGNPSAAHINALASRYGLATDYFGVTHPSEPNYVANIGGSYFGIQDDNQFYCTPALATTDPNCVGTTVNHTVSAPNLASELTTAGMTWKGYFQSLPPTPATYVTTGPNANGPYTFKYPSITNALYASKHNPFINFEATQAAVRKMVPDTQLATDLAKSTLPSYSLVVPDQCHDMHSTGSCPNSTLSEQDALIRAGDAYVAATVDRVMDSRTWTQGLDAIVITWDEDDYIANPAPGCCDSVLGGGHVVTIVITNRSPHPVRSDTPYNHYSLLRTMAAAFGVPCLAHACDAVDVPAMTALFRTR